MQNIIVDSGLDRIATLLPVVCIFVTISVILRIAVVVGHGNPNFDSPTIRCCVGCCCCCCCFYFPMIVVVAIVIHIIVFAITIIFIFFIIIIIIIIQQELIALVGCIGSQPFVISYRFALPSRSSIGFAKGTPCMGS